MKKLFFFLLIGSAHLTAEQKPKLIDHKKNVYSQWGEDGIIEQIFALIGTKSKVAVEFGAADGFWFSNTANLWSKDRSWHAILIESNPDRFKHLVNNVRDYSCTPLHRKVGYSTNDSLEAILSQAGVKDIDILSIDIDGDDYYIFQSLEHLHPRLIICEYNASIPAHLDVYQHPGSYMGSSVAALQRVAAEKGYTLVAITDTNCFFVTNEELPKFASYDIDREHIRIDTYITYMISDFSGKYAFLGSQGLNTPWGARPEKMPDFNHKNVDVLSDVLKRLFPSKKTVSKLL